MVNLYVPILSDTLQKELKNITKCRIKQTFPLKSKHYYLQCLSFRARAKIVSRVQNRQIKAKERLFYT